MSASQRRPSVEIFSMIFGIVYLLCFYMDFAPFRYYPDPRRFRLVMTPSDGPAILWYGWVAAAAVGSAVIAALVPRRLAEKLSPGWVWAIPLIIVILMLIYERRWFV